MTKQEVVIVGGGFAGSEAAWAAANRGCKVTLYEMRPHKMTPAHQTPYLAELVCSNSFKSNNPDSPAGQLKSEMLSLGSIMIDTALKHAVPGGEALAVDRELFAQAMTSTIEKHPNITVIRKEFSKEQIKEVNAPLIIATGPLTSESISDWIAKTSSQKHLYFYDAVSPTVETHSINRNIVWEQSRYDKGEAAYLNCPFNKQQYDAFVDALIAADQAPPHDFEEPHKYFEGCMPIEEIAKRGRESLRFGNFKPVGLSNPITGEKPYAVVQLRPENKDKTLYSLVACQTRLKWGQQKKVLQMIPGLENAEFVRLGVIHRNTYVDAPRMLNTSLLMKKTTKIVFLAGQITGVEGYVESGAMGILAGINAARIIRGLEPTTPPRETALGSLIAHITNEESPHFAPMNINWGLFPDPIPPPEDKQEFRKQKLIAARQAFQYWCKEHANLAEIL